MSKFEKKIKGLKELLNVVVFWFTATGGITVLAYIYEINRGSEVIQIGFFKQIIIYISTLTVGIIICFTDIIPVKVPQRYRVVITGFGLYIAMLIYFSKAAINPFQSVELFVLNTIWYIFMVFITGMVWFVYQLIVSNRYSKYLKDYQSGRWAKK